MSQNQKKKFCFYHSDSVEGDRRNPAGIHFYNKTKGGVDTNELL